MPKGTIKLISDRGFGFISPDEGKDIFFYRSALQGIDYRVDFESLTEGQRVQFEVGTGRDGRAEAIKVKLAQSKSE
ncbi:MAG: cold shock domain-containing protein [Dehalococcoidales bacterium]|nr:cold shock domain-containing protein [Dehalococcoidales bacterium]